MSLTQHKHWGRGCEQCLFLFLSVHWRTGGCMCSGDCNTWWRWAEWGTELGTHERNGSWLRLGRMEVGNWEDEVKLWAVSYLWKCFKGVSFFTDTSTDFSSMCSLHLIIFLCGFSCSVQAATRNYHRLGGFQIRKVHFSQFWKSKSKVQANSASSEGLLPGLETAVISLCPHMSKGLRGLSGDQSHSWRLCLMT